MRATKIFAAQPRPRAAHLILVGLDNKGLAPRVGVARIDLSSLLPAEIVKLAASPAHSDSWSVSFNFCKYIANGRSNMQIGQILDISEDTVKGHIRSILTKLDAMGRTKAIAIAAKRWLFQAGYLQNSLLSSSVILKCFTLSGGE